VKRTATRQINQNIREEFAGIRKDVRRHMIEDVAIEHARELLAQHAPSLVVGRAQVLLDSLLGYLMEDAIAALANAPTDTKNEFYGLGMRDRLKSSYTLKPQALQLSFDPRDIAGGVAAGGTLVTGGLIVGLVLSSLVSRVIAGLATLVASAVAFRLAHSAGTGSARKALESDVSNYLSDSEAQVSNWIGEVDQAFGDAFDKFACDHGMRAEGLS
jgi:hypothetical protein